MLFRGGLVRAFLTKHIFLRIRHHVRLIIFYTPAALKICELELGGFLTIYHQFDTNRIQNYHLKAAQAIQMKYWLMTSSLIDVIISLVMSSAHQLVMMSSHCVHLSCLQCHVATFIPYSHYKTVL